MPRPAGHPLRTLRPPVSPACPHLCFPQDDKITASLDRGVLELMVPKTAPPPKAEPKRIMVNAPPRVHGGEAPKVTHQAPQQD